MKVGIDAHFVTRLPRRGIGTYSLHLIREMVQENPDIEFYLYIRHPDLESVLPLAPNVRIRLIPAPLDPLWEQVFLPLAARGDRVDILHSLGNTGPLLLSKKIRQVLSLMDVMFLQSGEYVPKPVTFYQKIGRLYRSVVSPRCSRSASAVITISEFSKNDIIHFITGIDPNRLTVTHLDCDPLFSNLHISEQSNDGDIAELMPAVPFIFCLGADDPRKNTLRMVQAYLKLTDENGIAENLVIAGFKNWEHSPAYQTVFDAGATERVKFLPFVSTAELVNLYRSATLFAYPSLYEGFGIPMLEAFKAGCPVVASGVTSMPEVGGDAALYINPESVVELSSAMLRVINEPSLRDSMRSKGRTRAQQFSWKQVARQTIDVYRRCLADN